MIQRFVRAAFLVSMAAGMILHAQTKADEASVHAVPNAFCAAWANHSGHQLAQIMSDDVDFVNVGGDWLHGRHDFEVYHTRLLSGVFSKSNLKPVDTSVRFIRPDLAVLHWSWVVVGDGEEDPKTHKPRRSIFTMLAEKRNGVWQVIVSQNTNQIPGPNPELHGITPPIVFPN